MNELRPEYIEAVSTAVTWNPWFLLSLVIPPALLLPATRFRYHWLVLSVAFVLSLLLCWLMFGLGVRYIWEVKEFHAQTEAELADVTADTAKLFAPVLIGIPYAIIYTLIIQLCSLVVQAFRGWFRTGTAEDAVQNAKPA